MFDAINASRLGGPTGPLHLLLFLKVVCLKAVVLNRLALSVGLASKEEVWVLLNEGLSSKNDSSLMRLCRASRSALPCPGSGQGGVGQNLRPLCSSEISCSARGLSDRLTTPWLAIVSVKEFI